MGSATVTARLADGRNCSLSLGLEDSTMAHVVWGNPAQPTTLVRMFTETLVVTLPTPDFSMPYNVICLACTVAALAFGPIHNITTKSLVLVQPGQEEKGLLGKIFDKTVGRLLEKIKSLKGKKSVPTEDTQDISGDPAEVAEDSEVQEEELQED